MSFAHSIALERPAEIAMRDPEQALRWSEIDDLLNRCANGLCELDLGPERRIAVFAENAAETALANIGGFLAGASVVPVNFHLTSREVAHILADSGARVLFAGPTTLERGVEAARTTGVHTVIAWGPDARGEGVMPWAEWLADQSPREPDTAREPLPNLLYTSGTTGFPKGTHTPPTMFAGGATIAEHLELYRELTLERLGGELSTQLVVGPMYHTGPLSATRQLIAGVPSVILGRFDAEKTLAAIERHRVRTVLMVPTHFVRLLALPDEVRARYDLSSLVRVSHTGSKCPVDVKRAMINWVGPVLMDAYGASEVGTTCSIDSHEWLEHPGSVGRAVAPFTAMILGDDDQELPPHSEGRLFFTDATGRGVIYYKDPEKSAAAHIAPGVFTLGEIGYMDADGYVYITDRFSDMVVSGGVNIYPAEAEHVLIEHAAVLDVACIGVPDPEMGEALKALVMLGDGPTPDAPELIGWCRERLSHYKCPRSLEFVTTLGRNTMGKINKRKLRAPYWESESR